MCNYVTFMGNPWEESCSEFWATSWHSIFHFLSCQMRLCVVYCSKAWRPSLLCPFPVRQDCLDQRRMLACANALPRLLLISCKVGCLFDFQISTNRVQEKFALLYPKQIWFTLKLMKLRLLGVLSWAPFNLLKCFLFLFFIFTKLQN